MSALNTWMYDTVGKKPNVEPHDVFLNLGYLADDTQEPTPLLVKQNLYQAVVSEVDLKGKKVLEIGCGRGGGANYLFERLQPAQYVGIDISENSIAFCKRTHQHPGLEFQQADAQYLPFEDDSFDVVINVESSHCYHDKNRFLNEVHRVLKPQGHFCYCDVMTRKIEKKLRNHLEWMFEVKNWENITPYTMNAIEKTAPSTRKSIKKATRGLKYFLRKMYYGWAALPGSSMFRALINKKVFYLMVYAKAK